jgi:hypothetical protein
MSPTADLTPVQRVRVSPEIGGGLGGGMWPGLSDVTTKGLAPRTVADEGAVAPAPLPNLPRVPLPGFAQAGAAGSTAGGSLLAFALLLSGFLLVIPNAVRWLRPALALGLSPAYLAIGDRPG